MEGNDNAEYIIHWKFDNVRKWAINKVKLTDSQGGCSYGYSSIKFLQGIVYWITYLKIHGKLIVMADFDQKERDLDMYITIASTIMNKWQGRRMRRLKSLK